MDWTTFVALVRLRKSLELREEWVAVGHVSYLLDMDPEQNDPTDRKTQFTPTSFSIH
jgi:hypothetical protein